VSSAEAALEAAMLGVLAASEDVRAQLGDPLRVTRSGSPKPAYPYLEIVRHESEPWSGTLFDGSKHRIDVRVVSSDADGARAREAMAAVRIALVYAFLEAAPPAMDGWRCVYLGPVFSDLVRMSDASWRALLRVEAAVEAT
jgi:hypothetical protein